MSTALQHEQRTENVPDLRETIRLHDMPGVSRRRDVLSVRSDFTDYLVVEVDFLGNQDVDKIEMGHLRSFLKHLHKFNGASTIGRKLSTVRSFLDFCLREGLVKVNVSKALKAPKREERLPRHESTAGIDKLLEAPDDTVLGLRDRAILEVMYSAGLRVSELVGLNDADIDLEAGTVRVIGKGDRQRLSHLGQGAKDALAAWFAVRDTEGAVYTNYQGGRLGVRSVQKMVDKYTEKAGLGKLTPHALLMLYGIRWRLTYSTTVLTYEASKRCWVTEQSPARKSTPTSRRRARLPSTRSATREDRDAR
jgi:integrase/recombinase XerC